MGDRRIPNPRPKGQVKPPPPPAPPPKGVGAGDLMRFSVALLKQIYEEPDHASVLVRLKGVHVDADGCKVLLLERA